MARKILCVHCDAKLASGKAFCPNCERPTHWASLEERTEWELAQWKQAQQKPVAAKTAAPVALKRVSAKKPDRDPVPTSTREAPATTPVLPTKVVPRPAPRLRPMPVQAVAEPSSGHVTREPAPSFSPVRPSVRQHATSKKTAAAPKTAVAKTVAPKMAAAPKKTPRAKKAPAVAKPAAVVAKPAAASAKPAAASKPAVASKPAAARLAAVVAEKAIQPAETGARTPGAEDLLLVQTELLREIVRRVVAIEHKISSNGNGKPRRLRLLKRRLVAGEVSF
jgi:hypothetical protein